MAASFRTSLLALMRDKGTIFWTLLFPIILSTLFIFMFSGIEENYAAITSRLGLIESCDLSQAPGLEETLDAVSDAGSDEHIVDLTYFGSEEEAEAAAREGAIDAYLTLSSEGTPELHIGQQAARLPMSVLESVLDTYLHTARAMEEAARMHPEAAVSGELAQAFMGAAQKTVRVSYTKTAPNPNVRYYYALLAMSAGFGSFFAQITIRRLMAPLSPVGARQTLGAIPRWKMLGGALAASFACQLACLIAATLYMHLAAGVDFGDRLLGVILALALSTLVACCAGAFAGTFLHIETGMLSGIITLLSLFTGLYGQPSQQLADAVEAAVPALSHLNPLWQMAHAFFSLLYYRTLDAFFRNCFALLAMSLAFFILAALRMRRMSYEHL